MSLVSCFVQSHLCAIYTDIYTCRNTLCTPVVSVNIPVCVSVCGCTRMPEVDAGCHSHSMPTLFYFLRQELSFNFEPVDLSRLLGQWTLGIPATQSWDYSLKLLISASVLVLCVWTPMLMFEWQAVWLVYLLSSGHTFVNLFEEQVEFIVFWQKCWTYRFFPIDCYVLLHVALFQFEG